MEDGVYYIHCDRMGCNNIIGAQKYENGAIVEEEWVPDVVITQEGETFCKECSDKRDIFKGPEEIAEGGWYDSCD